MAENITVDFPDIAGDVSAYTAFLRTVAGTLLNPGGDALGSEVGGVFSFTLGETRVANTHYLVRIYSGSSETAPALVFAGMLYPGQTLVDFDGDLANLTVPKGVVDTGASTTSLTPSSFAPAGTDADQFKGRILVFDNNTLTPGLRGQPTDITANSADALPEFTFTSLTTAPVSGDTFKIS